MILCCGEALIDMLPRETTQSEAAFAPHAGGAVFNTAIGLGRLGIDTGYLGGLSTDLFGDILVDTLAASNVSTDLAPRVDRPTTLAFVTLTNGHAKYAFYDENTAGRLLAPADLPTLGAEVDALFFGGISLVAEPVADTLAGFLNAHAATRFVMIDPNIRPGFITNESRYRSRILAMMSQADVVKLSDEDLDWLGLTPEAVIAGGASVFLLTKGADGVEIHTRTSRSHVAAQKVDVVDTVGAGDTFNAGFLAGLAQTGHLNKSAIRKASDTDLQKAAALGNRVAAVTVSRAGANPPWAGELT